MMVVLGFLGFGIAFIGAVLFVISAFRVSILWGLGCLLLPIVTLIFLVLHWQESKNSFFLVMAGFTLMFITGFINGEVT
jgi:hypothetical protein